MNSKTVKNRLGIIKKGTYKNNFCIILDESMYIKSETLKYYTILKGNIMRNNENTPIYLAITYLFLFAIPGIIQYF
jgi:hypothetical protein